MHLVLCMILLVCLRASSYSLSGRIFFRSIRTASIMSKRASESSTSSATQKRTKLDVGAAEDSIELPFTPAGFNCKRARLLTKPVEGSVKGPSAGKCVVYWMSRDQRASDNHAIHYAQSVAQEAGVPLKIVFNLVPKFLEATIRQYGFMIKGLQELEQTLRAKNIPLHLLTGNPVTNIPTFVREHEAMLLVADFSPLRVGLNWVTSVASELDKNTSTSSSSGSSSGSTSASSAKSTHIPFVQVDAHNVVPCWVASPKLEYGARTIRSKISALLPQFLTPIPPLQDNAPGSLDCDKVDWDKALAGLEIDRSVKEVDWVQPGEKAAAAMLTSFIDERLKAYGTERNDPNKNALSNLSPYLHFGMLSAQAAVIRVKQANKHHSSVDSFVEETVVRRELSDNFCFYNNAHYDSLQGCYGWAKETLAVHSSDEREFVYTLEQLERGETYDDLWNAAQLQMVQDGKMHGFLRMYWAKKILEWSPSPEEALRRAILLNDKYELDGRDPNGYVGCMWSIGGIHDQGWGERPIFGKIRFMNYKGCQRKFDVKAFVARYPPAVANAAAAASGGANSSGGTSSGGTSSASAGGGSSKRGGSGGKGSGSKGGESKGQKDMKSFLTKK